MKINLTKCMLIGAVALFASYSTAQNKVDSDVRQPVDYVNPYMGNISHLLVPTYPTIQLPNSMLRVYPEREDYTSVQLHGLPIEVTSHRGSSAFNLSPYQGDVENLKPVISYGYDLEKLTPYSYSVYLDEQQIEVNFGLSHQAAMYELNFEKNAPVYLVLNSKNGGMSWNGTAVSGYQLIDNNTKVYLYLEPEKLPQHISVLDGIKLLNKDKAEGEDACIVLGYPEGTKKINVHYGVSFIDIAQAKKNMEREVLGKNVKMLQDEGRTIWNKALGKISVQGGTENERVVFYTSLYRCYERPVCISENGRYYSAFDGKVHSDGGRPFYTDDWIWDTYRALHPLRILLDPQKEENILNSFVVMAGQSKHFWMPTFPEITGDARAMNCNHGVASVLDAYRKGLRNFDIEKAYQACKGAIMEKTLAPWSEKPAGKLDQFYKDHGYIPALRPGEKETIPEVNPFERRQAVPVTLGTSYDEWCLSQIANELGKTADAAYFLKCSFNYRNLFNPKTGFFHPKDSIGNFIEPFDYVFSGGLGDRDYYDENNGWIYRWDVPQNIPDLIHLMGGDDAFVRNLDATFSEPLGKGKVAFYAQLPDHTGNVGQFSMGNEPSMDIPYLYNYAGYPWKTQKMVRELLQDWFRNDLEGVPGDEDGGGLSSFVVFSMMGFYPVTPGEPVYSIGSPLFKDVKIHLGNGNVFEIKAPNASDDNKYIESAKLNGMDWNHSWITHENIEKGGVLEFIMGDKANKLWGSLVNDVSPSAEVNNNRK
jgi:predicted alpha-1,2-mannosidase